MVTAAEIDISMSVRTLEELTYVKTANWQRFYFYVKSDVSPSRSRPAIPFDFYGIISSVERYFDHPDSASYPEEFIANVCAVVSRVQVSWKDITVERIRGAIDRISKRDWRSDLPPLITGNKWRFSIFNRTEQNVINAAREMKELPDLSALIKKKLSGGKKTSYVSSRPSVGPINIKSSREELVQSSERETTEPSVTDGNKKKRSAPDSSASIDTQGRTGSDEPPRKKKKKKEKKKRKKSIEGQSEPIGDAEGHEPVIHEGSSHDAAARAVVESSDSPNIPVEKRKKPSCGSDASASAAKTPSVAPPTTTGVVQPRRNIESNSASALNSSGAKDMPPVKDFLFKDAYVDAARTKVLSDGSMNYVVELYDTALKETISKLKQSDRLVRARDTVLNRKMSAFRVAIDKAAAEQSRLLAGKKAQKEKFMEKFGELKDKFKNAGEEGGYSFKASEGGQPVKGLSKLRGLIDAGTVATLQTPTSSQGDHATERSNESTVRELGESSVQGHEVVSRVERSEDATAPLVLDPAPSIANLVVSEESLIPILGVSDVNLAPPLGVEEAGSEPVDLLEISDSSAEEEGGEKSDERVPGDNPQGKEEGVVDEVENPPASTTDEAGGASDQLEARVVEEDPDRAEN
ncbi:hypothetical protein Bca4012_097528 [Brassica carinata]